jgi:hypothetical protein
MRTGANKQKRQLGTLALGFLSDALASKIVKMPG